MMDFHSLYQSYAPQVHRFALFLCGDAALADDLTSETFVRAWTARGKIREATVKAYLFTIARNLYRDHLRRNRRNTELDESIRPEPGLTYRAQGGTGCGHGRFARATRSGPCRAADARTRRDAL